MLITPSEVINYAFSAREQITPQSIKISKILTSCEQYIRPRFGDNLYDKFTEGQYTPFVDEYLKPAIAHYVRYSIIDELSIQLSDNGAVLFEDSEQESLQVRQNTLTQTSQDKTIGEDTVNDQLIGNSRNTVKTTTQNDAEKSVELDKNSQEDSKIIGETMKSQTEIRDQTTTITDEVNKTVDTIKSSTDLAITEDTKERDYNFHESPQTVGVSTTGYSHDVQNNERKVTNSLNGNDVSSENRDGSTLYKTNDKLTDKDQTDQTTNKTGLYTSVQHSTDTSSINRNNEAVIERQDSTNRVSEINRQTNRNDERKSTDDDKQNLTQRQRTSASDYQRRIIRARALADASILINRAIRYVERNAILFPEYEPKPRNYGRIVM